MYLETIDRFRRGKSLEEHSPLRKQRCRFEREKIFSCQFAPVFYASNRQFLNTPYPTLRDEVMKFNNETTLKNESQLVGLQATRNAVHGGRVASLNESPPSVLRGANSHELTEVSIDWLRMSGPRSQVWEAKRMLETYFGPTEEGAGRFFLNTGHHWAEGGVFLDMDKTLNKRHCLVELPGKMLGELEHYDIRQIMHNLASMGFKTTRVDIALDFYNRPNLIDTINQSCLRGELCRSKTFQYIEQRNQDGLTGNGINIGKRGKMGSGRYLRVYDKGLETKTLDAGDWIRWEVELSDDCSQQFVLQYITQDNTIETCISHALWVVEFREKTGAAMLSRRPLAEWFKEITQEVRPERVRAIRTKSTVESYTRWIKTAVAPKLETIAAATRTSVAGVMRHLAGKVDPQLEHLQCPKVRTVSVSMGADPQEMYERVIRGKTNG